MLVSLLLISREKRVKRCDQALDVLKSQRSVVYLALNLVSLVNHLLDIALSESISLFALLIQLLLRLPLQLALTVDPLNLSFINRRALLF